MSQHGSSHHDTSAPQAGAGGRPKRLAQRDLAGGSPVHTALAPAALPTAAPTALPADVEAAIEALRAQGLPALDPAGFHHLQTLARRASGLKGPVRRYLEGRLAQALLNANGRLAAASAATAAQRTADTVPAHATTAEVIAPLSPLALLTRELHALHETPGERAAAAALHTGHERSARRAPAGELRALRAFKSTWANLRDEQRLAQALAAVPPNAGPLNTQRLVLRSLQRMRELSPGYFHRFVSHLETLQWLEQDSLLADLADGRQRQEVGIAQRQGGRSAKLRPLRK